MPKPLNNLRGPSMPEAQNLSLSMDVAVIPGAQPRLELGVLVRVHHQRPLDLVRPI